MSAHAATWKEIAILLREARSALATSHSASASSPVSVGVLTGTLGELDELLDHNELELAWDTLAEVAERSGAQRDFWQKLAQAAGLMQLGAKRDKALARIPGC
jgi:predicted Zn-dependent protease